jgi:hypothetical protein
MRHSFIFLLFVLLGTATCKKESLEPTIIVANIEREFALSYVEKFSKTGRYLQFNVYTLKEQSCGNYVVKTEWLQSPTSLKLNISGLEKKGDCDGNPAIARGNATTDLIAEGTWPIDVVIQNLIRNPGKLVVEKTNYQLLLETSHGISSMQKDLQKIPSGSIWGFIAYKPEFAATARGFVEDLKKLTRNNPLPDGDYGYFEIESEVVKYKETPAAFSYLPILRLQYSDVDVLLNLVNTFRKNNAENITIQLFDTNGISY